MTEEQQKQFISFIANFVYIVHQETDMDIKQAQWIANLAAAALLGAVFDVLPEQDKAMDDFVEYVLKVALKREYATLKVVD